MTGHDIQGMCDDTSVSKRRRMMFISGEKSPWKSVDSTLLDVQAWSKHTFRCSKAWKLSSIKIHAASKGHQKGALGVESMEKMEKSMEKSIIWAWF